MRGPVEGCGYGSGSLLLALYLGGLSRFVGLIGRVVVVVRRMGLGCDFGCWEGVDLGDAGGCSWRRRGSLWCCWLWQLYW